MKKNLFRAFLIGALFLVYSCNFAQKFPVGETAGTRHQVALPEKELTQASVKWNMEYLASDDLRGRETGTPGIEKAALFIEDAFRKANVRPYFETYRDSFEVNGRIGYNLIGLLEGKDPELMKQYVILGAHYDHVGLGKTVEGDSIANGANDNASGTVAVMELAKIFSGLENKRSLLFILFSAEEMGLEGAKHLAEKLKHQGLDLYTMVNFEMIGVPMEDKNYLAYLTGYERSNLAEKFNEYSGAEVLGFLPQAKQYNLFQRSDNYPFYLEFKVPAQTLSTFDFTNFEYYHHVFDEPQRMDYAHMTNVIHSVVPGLYMMANTSEKEIKLEE